MLTGKKKADLVKAINEGMKKTVTDKLKKDYDMLSLKPIKSKPLEKPVDKPKSEPPARKTRVVKSEPVRSTPPPKPQRKIPKNRRGGIPDIDKEISSLLKTSEKIEKKTPPKKEVKKTPPKKNDAVEGLKSMVESAKQKDKKTKVDSSIYKDIVMKMKSLLKDRNKVGKINQLVDDGKSFGKIQNLKNWFDEKFKEYEKLVKELEQLQNKNKNVKMSSDQEMSISGIQDFFESNRFYSN